LFSKKKNFAHIYQLQQEIQRIKQSGESITEIFSKLQKKKEELKLYRPPIDNPKKAQRREEQDEFFEFLAIIESSYQSARSQILLMIDLPPLDEAVVMLEREEIRRVVMGQKSKENTGESLSCHCHCRQTTTIPKP
jgi:hypothetical protein